MHVTDALPIKRRETQHPMKRIRGTDTTTEREERTPFQHSALVPIIQQPNFVFYIENVDQFKKIMSVDITTRNVALLAWGGWTKKNVPKWIDVNTVVKLMQLDYVKPTDRFAQACATQVPGDSGMTSFGYKKRMHKEEYRNAMRVALNADGRYLAATELLIYETQIDNKTSVYDTHTGKAMHEFDDLDFLNNFSVALSADGSIVATADDTEVVVRDLKQHRFFRNANIERYSFKRNGDFVLLQEVALSARGDILAIRDEYGAVQVRNLQSAEGLKTVVEHASAMSLSADGRYLATAHDHLVSVRNLHGSIAEQLPSMTHNSIVQRVSLSANARYLASGCVREVYVRDLQTNTEKTYLHDDTVVDDISLSADGRFLAVIFWPGRLVVRSVRTGVVVLERDEAGQSVALSSDGQYLAYAGHLLQWQTPLFVAAEAGDIKVVKKLLAAGAMENSKEPAVELLINGLPAEDDIVRCITDAREAAAAGASGASAAGSALVRLRL